MNEYYYELKVKPTRYVKLFADFLDDVVPIGYEERDGTFIIRNEESLETVQWGIEQFVEALQKATAEDIEVEMEYNKYKNSDWVEAYQKSIQPLQIGKFYIHPTWDPPHENYINIVIDPALAFGTGHHPTTATCMEAISKYVSEKDEVCDVGCGSGILAIAAMKLGAVADGCDTDPISVENARTNAKLNGVAFRDLWEGSINKSLKKYDVVIANIVADVLIFLKKDLAKVLKDESSLLILSGILDKYEAKVLENYKEFDLVERIAQDEWVSLVLKKKEY
ncbi:MAG: 50S ribosomal protein L11 methyltransferase [Epsilonproteobacteria bacterium]|nr:50S ribosomal protein L11 methyltransferase [Campylobacterota bacterium]